MLGDGARRDPDAVACGGDVGQRAAEVPQPVRVADEIGVERDAHHQRRVGRLLEHLVEGVDDHVGELRRADLARDDRRDVVELLRVGHREDAAAVAHAQEDRLVVHRPVEEVAVAGFGEEVGRHAALRNPRSEPALRRPSLFRARMRSVASAMSARSAGLVERALPLGIGAAVADDLVAARCGRRRRAPGQ